MEVSLGPAQWLCWHATRGVNERWHYTELAAECNVLSHVLKGNCRVHSTIFIGGVHWRRKAKSNLFFTSHVSSLDVSCRAEFTSWEQRGMLQCGQLWAENCLLFCNSSPRLVRCFGGIAVQIIKQASFERKRKQAVLCLLLRLQATFQKFPFTTA